MSEIPLINNRDLPTVDEIDVELARRELAEFVRQAWCIVEPVRKLEWNWHLDHICQHLEAVTRGDIRRLVINIPPGCMKSLLVSVFWPAWEWITAPHIRTWFGSHDSDLSLRDRQRCRMILESKWYKTAFKPHWRFATDQNVKSYYLNTVSGYHISIPRGKGGTGHRGDKVIIDDPLGAHELNSQTVRQVTTNWVHNILPTRLNSLKEGAIVIVMQRLDSFDTSQECLDIGGWEHLCLPMEYSEEVKSDTSLNLEDPRTEPGECMFPELFPEEELVRLRRTMMEDYEAQYNQNPPTTEGKKFKTDKIQIVDQAPADLVAIARYWDRAATKSDKPDQAQTAGVKMGIDSKGVVYVLDIEEWAEEPEDVVESIHNVARQDGKSIIVGIEQDPGQAGKFEAKFYVRKLVGYTVEVVPARDNKVVRARPFMSACNGGNVRIVKAPWNRSYLDQLKNFPGGKLKDKVDASSGAYMVLVNEVEEEDIVVY